MAVERDSAGPEKIGDFDGCLLLVARLFYSGGPCVCFAVFAGDVCGRSAWIWAAWIFAGLDFLLFLGLVFSLFVTAKRSKIWVESVSVNRVREGETATVTAYVAVRSTIDCVTLGANRLPPSLTGFESDREKIKKGEPPRKMECLVRTTRRGSFMLNKVSANVPEIMGLLRWPYGYNGSVELLVYPRALKVQEFSFLTQGASGMAFAPFLMPSLTRGMNFIGVRPYREGDRRCVPYPACKHRGRIGHGLL